MTDLDEPIRRIVVEPAELPEPLRRQIPAPPAHPEPVADPRPEREPVHVGDS